MKYLPLRDFDDVANALNFHTPDCKVIGSCDLYTTKAAGADKKLYRDIENSLESQYSSLLRLSASVSPPHGSSSVQSSLNLSRSSPFGPLSQLSSRRTFAYLIATLNASHPDYDFSHNLRPSDFKKERSLKVVINTINTTLYNLRPSSGMTLQVPSQASYATGSSAGAGQSWGPHMWNLIDKEMTLKDCSVYCWVPPDDPFDGEESSLWSMNYFFFNKERKRVTYMYVRGVSSPTPRHRVNITKRSASGYEMGSNKRARYWLGDQAANVTNGEADDSEEYDSLDMWNEDDPNGTFDEDDFYGYEDYDDYDDYDDEADDESDEQSYKGPVRGVSEDIAAHIAANMDMD